MDNKKLVSSVLCGLVAIGCIVYFVLDKENKNKPVEEQPVEIQVQPQVQPKVEKKVQAPVKQVKKVNLRGDNSLLPLSSVAEIASLPENVQSVVEEYIQNSDLYYLKRNGENVFMIIGNMGDDKYPRHDIEFVEVYPDARHKTISLAQACDNSSDKLNEWKFQRFSELPLEHIKRDENGEIEYIETWNYSADEPVKYEMKNGEGKTLSIKKETPDGDTKIRSEHLIYDEDGNTKITISTSYEGPDITRFTYYNSELPQDGVTLMSEYEDGLKVKETVYSTDYKLQNTYNAVYKDGERVNLKVLDSQNVEIDEFLAE